MYLAQDVAGTSSDSLHLLIPNSLIVIPAYLTVQKADKFFQCYVCPFSAVEHFIFDPPEEALHRTVIPAVSAPTHTLLDPVSPQ